MNYIHDVNLKSFTFPSIIEDKEQGILRIFESENLPFIIKGKYFLFDLIRAPIFIRGLIILFIGLFVKD